MAAVMDSAKVDWMGLLSADCWVASSVFGMADRMAVLTAFQMVVEWEKC